MTRALEGFRVVDFSHVVAGPLATHFLALNGARVIKVEAPTGDLLRNYAPSRDQWGMAPAFRGINIGKDSVSLDLKTDAGLATAKRLMAEADIVVENFRPGVMERLGLGYEAARTLNPRIIYCSVSGFGQTGEMRDVAAIDQIVQSLSGLMRLSGEEGDPAMRIGFPIVDTYSGLLAAFAIQTAVIQRERGLVESQNVDVAMLDATLVMLASVVNPLLMAGQKHMRTGNRGFSRAPTADTFACRTGELTVGAVEDHHVAKMLKVLGLTDLLDDPRFATRIDRLKNADAMRAKLAESFSTRDALDWEHAFRAEGLSAARVMDVEEAVAMPHLAERGLFLEVAGERVLNAGFRLATGSPGTDRGAPELGAQNEKFHKAAT
ncbi:CaiB/BaiF CoA-transferase family protein [Maritimibacter sp. DP1N21-5]|uniref:CaiB/BaiF CoA transferase family protein n=1 Tax=Maritimibacter sp. DP1N21-5 TaxID=2836867 RepID=UPI001C438A6E|nr:CoA transferase [Maritimibacter sp. DP1N21-5]MBV7407391.1 CoA transferase [Maritimibacter sp. DP1N21-5]